MRDVPRLARILGLAGLLPQFAFVLVLHAGPPEWHDAARSLAFAYAALIYSFIGGMWWGFAAAAPAAERRQSLGWLWVAAVLPSLVALAAFLPWVLGLPWPEPSLAMLGGAILLSPAIDARLGPLAPRWWMQLRVVLSLGLGVATLLVALS